MTVWYDFSLVPGDRFPETIQQRIDDCAAFVVVLTPAARESDWVGREISYAVDQRKPVLPIMLRQPRYQHHQGT